MLILFIFRDLRHKLLCLRQWSRDSKEAVETLSVEERLLVTEIIDEVVYFQIIQQMFSILQLITTVITSYDYNL